LKHLGRAALLGALLCAPLPAFAETSIAAYQAVREALVAALVAVACTGMFYEVLHFRHVWALFGLVAALALAREP